MNPLLARAGGEARALRAAFDYLTFTLHLVTEDLV